MKKLAFAILIIASTSYSHLAFAETDTTRNAQRKMVWKLDSDSSTKLDLSFGVASNLESYAIGVETPSFFSATNQSISNRFGAYLDLRSIQIKNIIRSRATGKLSDSRNLGLGFGLVSRVHYKEDFAIFTKIGGSKLFMDKALAERTVQWGYRLEFGAEHLYPMIDTKQALFTSLSWDWNDTEADKIPGSPQLFNVMAINIGLRAFL